MSSSFPHSLADIHHQPQLSTTDRFSSLKQEASRRVLHLINGEHFSGAERVQDLLAMALPGFGYDVEFACLKPVKFPNARQSTCALHQIPMRSKFDWRSVDELVRLVCQREYEIIHAHTPRTLLVARLALSRLKKLNADCRLVYHVHSPVGLDSNRSFSNRVNSWMESWSLKKADQIICVSNSLQRYMQQTGFPADKISVVSNGVAVIKNLPQRPVPDKVWTIGTMALFRPRKGTEVLLEAMKMLQDQKRPVVLRAVGPFETPQYERDIMSLVDQLGIGDMIQWVGFQTDVNAQLQQMDLFVLPSLYGEGLPMVVLEAMANGVPVLASQVEGIPEAIRDGIDGRIFQPNNAKDLFVKIAKTIGRVDRWQEMRQSCIERQQSKLSDTSMARGVAQVYDRLLGIVSNQGVDRSSGLPVMGSLEGLGTSIQSQVLS